MKGRRTGAERGAGGVLSVVGLMVIVTALAGFSLFEFAEPAGQELVGSAVERTASARVIPRGNAWGLANGRSDPGGPTTTETTAVPTTATTTPATTAPTSSATTSSSTTTTSTPTTTVPPTTTSSSATTTTTTPAPTTTTTAATTTTTSTPTTTTTTATTTSTIETAAAPSGGRETIWTGSQKADWKSEANSGKADIVDVDHELLGPALKLSNYDVDGSHNAGARINHQGFDDPTSPDPVAHAGDRIMPTEAWYSATYLLPFAVDGQDNVFQFKQGDGSTRRHLWNVGWKPVDGELRFVIRTRLDGSTWRSTPREVAVLGPVPVGTPFRIEVFRRMSTGPDGRYEVRIDGNLVYTYDGPTIADNLDPRPAGNHEWVLSHYLGSWQGTVDPADSWLYVTDARIER